MFLDQNEQTAFATFSDAGWITEILDTIKSGKEATVYRCKAGPRYAEKFLALKVYCDLKERNFKNDAIYMEGRVFREGKIIGDCRMARAMKKKTTLGQAIHLYLWVDHEYETLCTLYNAGAGVPKPIAKTNNAILMEYLGDEEATAGPLNTVVLADDEARTMFSALMDEIELWLACDIVHADLSAYNIVYWKNRPMVIDFPQAVDPRFNGNAFDLLSRDITNLCKHFRKYGIESDAGEIADNLWERWKLGQL